MEPPDSWIVTPAPSSSVSVSVADDTATPDRTPDTVTVSLFRSMLSATGVSQKEPVSEVAPAGMVMLNPATGAKPTTFAPPEPATEIATCCAVPNRVAPPTVAVTCTVVAPASSATVAG